MYIYVCFYLYKEIYEYKGSREKCESEIFEI